MAESAVVDRRQPLQGEWQDALNGERLSADAPRLASAPALPRQIGVDGPNRRPSGGVRGCWAM
jgi:hypothetical protein